MNDMRRNRSEATADIPNDPDFAGIQKRARTDSDYTFDDKENYSWQSNTWNAIYSRVDQLDADLEDLAASVSPVPQKPSTVKDEDEKESE